MERRKPDAPALTETVRAFIAASRQAEGAYLTKAKQTQRRVRWALLLAALCFLAIVLGVTGWNEDYLKNRVYVWRNVNALTAAQEKTFKPKDNFKECTDCPEMVVVPNGNFVMGSHDSDEARPLHSVTIAKPFAVSKYELTFAEWDACEAQGGCVHAGDSGFGRGRQPVINVSWDDAKQYVTWLSRITGTTYRLLSEAEYEYAARGGNETKYPWGKEIKLNGTAMANCLECGSQWVGKQTAPVGSFAANGFGLYDTVGNVWEWTEDCYHDSYDGAPTDGSAWLEAPPPITLGPLHPSPGGYCTSHVVRGGAWDLLRGFLHSANRAGHSTVNRTDDLGFRVARTH